MKKLKLLCSAIAALALFALASCDLEIRDKFGAVGAPTAVHVASGSGSTNDKYYVFLGLDGFCSGTKPELVVNKTAKMDINSGNLTDEEDVDKTLASTTWDSVAEGAACRLDGEGEFIVLYEFKQTQKGADVWNQFWVAVSSTPDSLKDKTAYYQRIDDWVPQSLEGYADEITHSYPTGESKDYDYTDEVTVVAVKKTATKIIIAIFADTEIDDPKVENYLMATN
ncbi:MAG: hypothetical protein J1D88_03780 [Treponema sp.]|nr:hypothetical protein [Treponema sp.]